MRSWYVYIIDFNTTKLKKYDVMPYFLECAKKQKFKSSDLEKCKKFIRKEGMYMFWARCEWEVLICPWPSIRDISFKIDVWDQIEMNLDNFTMIFIENLNKE
jgi:hypothetical protein